MSTIRTNIKRDFGKTWIQNENKNVEFVTCPKQPDCGYNPHKLHISLHSGIRTALDTEINEILDDAVENEIIHCYKRMQPAVRINSDMRNAHLPYVLYLQPKFDEENFKKVLLLCQKLEKLLTGVESGYSKYFSKCYLPFSIHFTYREAARDGEIEYIAADDKDDKLIEQLREQGLKSQYFTEFQKRMSLADPSEDKHAESKSQELPPASGSALHGYLIKLFMQIHAEKNVFAFRSLIENLQTIIRRPNGPLLLQKFNFGDLLWASIRRLFLMGMIQDADFILKKCAFLMNDSFSNYHLQVVQEGYSREIQLLVKRGLNPIKHPKLLTAILQNDNLTAFRIFYEVYPEILQYLPKFQQIGMNITKFISDMRMQQKLANDLANGIMISPAIFAQPELAQIYRKFRRAEKCADTTLNGEIKCDNVEKRALFVFGPKHCYLQTRAEKIFYAKLANQPQHMHMFFKNEIARQLMLKNGNEDFLFKLVNFDKKYLGAKIPKLSSVPKLPAIKP